MNQRVWNRRELLKDTGKLSILWGLQGFTLLEAILASRVEAATGWDLSPLTNNLSSDDALILVPTDELYARYNQEFNLRTAKLPAIRILVKNTQAVVICLQWLKKSDIPFSIRCGGHSFEGLSQCSSVVIDTRLINEAHVDVTHHTVTVGGGASLGHIYKTITAYGFAYPGGSCPNVGVSGHILGGGYGLLGRTYGLACDNLISAEIVTADGKIETASQDTNPDLFWALKGGGGGSFGVVTSYTLKLHPLDKVSVFGISWNLPKDKASPIFKNWQSWIHSAPSEITSLFRLNKNKDGTFYLYSVGQSTKSETWLQNELRALKIVPPNKQMVKTLSFMDAVKHFAGKEDYISVYMKGKSDYIYDEMSEDGINIALTEMDKGFAGSVGLAFDGYGGQIANVRASETAFVHRDARSVIQYFCQWQNNKTADARMAHVRAVHKSLRPYVSGYAYVNYCDTDIADWAQAYWGGNLERLIEVKSKWDPNNFFKHAQSIPVKE
jgi:FAD/FMN-containing dehydrogenase